MSGKWIEGTLGDLIELKRGFDLPQQHRQQGDVPVVSSSGVTDRHATAKVSAPGVVTGRYGTLGEVFYVDEDFWPLNTTLYVRDFKGNDPRFISYFLRGIDFLAYSDKAAVPGLNRNHLHQAKVRYPADVGEQRAIAQVLASLDDKVDLNRRMSQTLEAMARALFKSWFVDFEPVRAKAEGRDPGLPPAIADAFPNRFEDGVMGEIPAGWSTVTLGDVTLKPEYGYTASAQSEQVGPKFLRITDINKQPWIAWNSVPYCQTEAADERRFRVHPGDLLVARMADPGHAAMIEESVDAVFASYLIRFRPNDANYARYLQYWTRSDAYWDLVKARGLGTTRTTLNAQVLRAFPLLLPPRHLAAAFDRHAGALREKLVVAVRESETLVEIRDALLPKLISGENSVQHADRLLEGAPI